jgi:DNA-binding NtrC family response regulator
MDAAAPPPIVLCVDDDEDQLAGNARILRLERLQVITTPSPHEALEILARSDVAVLVSDFEMPEMTGVELSAAARTTRPETIRIMLTGRGTFDTAVAGINQGEIFRFLTKPVEPGRLRQDVLAACARHLEQRQGAVERNLSARRAQLRAELEQEHAGITATRHDERGRYVLDPGARARVAGIGLEPLLALWAGRPQSE